MSSANRKSKPKVSPSKTLHDFDGSGVRHTSPKAMPVAHSAVVRFEIDPWNMTENYHGCIEVLESTIGKVGLAPQAEFVYAESMIRTGQIASGAERLGVLEKLHPEIPDVHRALGEALVQQGEKQRALEELHAAIQLSPRDADSHYDIGKMELEGGDPAAAIPELEAATRLLPNSEKFHQELADAYTAALRPADAQKEMETCNLLRARAK
jgi:predicted Zn-dependent protease